MNSSWPCLTILPQVKTAVQQLSGVTEIYKNKIPCSDKLQEAVFMDAKAIYHFVL